MDICHSAASYRLSDTCYALNCTLEPLMAWDEHRGYFFNLKRYLVATN